MYSWALWMVVTGMLAREEKERAWVYHMHLRRLGGLPRVYK